MKNFFDWFRGHRDRHQPWLILGKGPSFGRQEAFDLSAYATLSLNDVVRTRPVDLAHMIDTEALARCADQLAANAGMLVMPWYPHVRNQVGDKTLAQWAAELPVLQRLESEGRLLWYDLSTSKQRHGDQPVVEARSFSAEAALHLLALAGVGVVRSLGVDGGASYSNAFDHLKHKTLLNNGHASFDLQFEGFARTILATGVDYAPLAEESPIRVYVGSQEEQMLAVKVLEYSIRRHASMTVEVMPLHEGGIDFPMPRDPANRPRTPFSFLRFTIPQLAGYRGRAIYLDSDMLVFQDVRKLWNLPFNGAELLAACEADATSRRPQFSVMLLDCERLQWTPQQVVDALDSGRLDYARLMHDMALADDVRATIPATWNSLEHYEAGRTALLHYTDMNHQPWVHRGNRWGPLWSQALKDAMAAGFIEADAVREHVARGWVRPSLLAEVGLGDGMPHWLPGAGAWQDRRFVPPYKRMPAAA